MTDEAKALVANLRDEDSYYRIQEKHWCIDGEELERQRLAAADLIETQARENERLRGVLQNIMALEDDFESNAAMTAHEWQMFHIARAALAGDSDV